MTYAERPRKTKKTRKGNPMLGEAGNGQITVPNYPELESSDASQPMSREDILELSNEEGMYLPLVAMLFATGENKSRESVAQNYKDMTDQEEPEEVYRREMIQRMEQEVVHTVGVFSDKRRGSGMDTVRNYDSPPNLDRDNLEDIEPVHSAFLYFTEDDFGAHMNGGETTTYDGKEYRGFVIEEIDHIYGNDYDFLLNNYAVVYEPPTDDYGEGRAALWFKTSYDLVFGENNLN